MLSTGYEWNIPVGGRFSFQDSELKNSHVGQTNGRTQVEGGEEGDGEHGNGGSKEDAPQ